MTSLQVKDLVPHDMVVPSIHSASSSVIRRRKAEILPNAQLSYKWGGSDRIEFNIQSPSDFLDTMNSYLRFELRTTGLSAAGVNDINRSLNTGGAHALFKSMELRLPSGVSLELIQDYNKYYAINSYATHSADYVKYVEHASGDSLAYLPRQDDSVEFNRKLTGGWTIVADDETITSAAANGNAVAEISVGDELQARDLNTNRIVWTGRVHEVTDDDNLEVTPAPDQKVDSDDAELYARQRPARQAVCNSVNTLLTQTGIVVSMKPMLQLLNMKELLPLFLLKGGIQLTCELADPVYALRISDNDKIPVATAALDYQIENPRFIAEFVQGSESTVKQYISMYNADAIHYPFLATRHYMSTQDGSNSDISFAHNVNLRSLRYALAVCENNRSNTKSSAASSLSNTYVYDSIGTFLDAKISSYQWKSGSEQFPLVKVDSSDASLTEPFVELQKTFNQYGGLLYKPRFEPSEWRKVNINSDTGASDESHRFIMSTRFDRMGFLSGYDSSIGTMNLHLETSDDFKVAGQIKPRYVHVFYVSDAILSIGISGVMIRR